MSRNPLARGEADAPRSRRSLLKLLGVGALGLVGGAAARSDTARATDGANLVLGSAAANTAETSTKLTTNATISNDGAFVVEATAADWAIEGDSGNLGVLGSGFIGVMGTGDVGGFFSGNLAAISLQPQDAAGAPTSGLYSKGDMLIDSNGVLWLCVAGTGVDVGTWIKVSHGGVRPLAAPKRAYDSRYPADYPNGSNTGKLGAAGTDGSTGNARTISITSFVSDVPSNAVGIVGNLTITQADGASFAAVWPSGAWPQTSNVNFVPGVDVANAFTVGLGGGGTICVATYVPAHVIVDVAGYIL